MNKSKNSLETIKAFKLRSEEEKAQAYLKIAGSIIVVIRADGTIELLNKKGCEVLGANESDVVGKNWFDNFIPEKNRKDIKRVFRKIMKGELELYENFENYVITKSGEQRLIAWHNGNVTDENGKIFCTISSGEDITDKRLAELKLRASEERYKELYEEAPIAYFSVGSNNQIQRCNLAAVSLLGYSKEELLKKKILDLYDDTEYGKSKAKKAFKKFLKGDILKDEELMMKKKNGESIWISLTVRPVLNDSGEIIESRSMVIDISNRKKKNEELSNSEAKFRKIFESSPIGMVLYDLNESDNLIIQEANPSANKILEVNINEYKGLTMEEVFPPLAETELPEIYRKIAREGGTASWDQIDYDHKEINGSFYIHIFQMDKNQVVASFLDISTRIENVQKLKESEKKFRNIIENTKDAIVIIDFEGKLLYISPQLSKMLKGREITKNSRFFQYIHKDDIKKLISFYKATLKEKTFSEKLVEFRLLPKQGDYMWFSSSSKSYYDDDGKVIGFISTLQDITDKKLAEQKLKESEQKYRYLFESSPFYIILLDEDWKIYDCNPSTEKILGYTKHELIGKNARDIPLYDLAKEKRLRERTKNIINGKELKSIEMEIPKKEGNLIWIKSLAALVEIGKKKFIEVIGQDITERKITEEELIKSEERYRNLVETSSLGLIEIDMVNKLVSYINPKFAEFTGYNRKELKTQHQFHQIVNREDLERIGMMRGEKNIEFRITTKSGDEKWLFGTRLPGFDENGEIVSLRLWVSDITENKKLEDIKKNLLTRFSHEFKTPLISIKGFADFLLNTYNETLNKKALSFLQNIKMGSDRLEVLTNSFIESSRLGLWKIRLEECKLV